MTGEICNKHGRGKPLPYAAVGSAFMTVGAGLAPPAMHRNHRSATGIYGLRIWAAR